MLLWQLSTSRNAHHQTYIEHQPCLIQLARHGTYQHAQDGIGMQVLGMKTLQAMVFVWTNIMVFGVLFASSAASLDAIQPRSF